jgi:hypothetical protein
MMFEIDRYNREVLEAFQEIKDQEKLAMLQRATRANLMKECIRRLDKGELDRDLADLTKIFGSDGTRENLRKAIRKAGSDRFRPVQDFFQKRTSKPTDNITTLLAIFIDFEPRPYDYWRELRQVVNEEAEKDKDILTKENSDDHDSVVESNTTYLEGSSEGLTNEIIDNHVQKQHLNGADIDKAYKEPPISAENEFQSSKVDGSIDETSDILKDEPSESVDLGLANSKGTDHLSDPNKRTNQQENQIKKFGVSFLKTGKKRNFLLGGAGILTCATLAMLISDPDKDCMCWNGEQYIQVSCQDKTQRYQVIGLDQNKLDNFQKIMKLDTVRLEDIDHIWYSKIDNEYEFFTAPGRHPIAQTRSLKATTKYIWETKINGRSDNNQNSRLGIMDKQ